MVILSVLACIMAIALLITWRMGQQIKKPIASMTTLTELMKKAPNLSEKTKVVNQMALNSHFEDINEQYVNMRSAKSQLRRRFEHE